MSQWIQNAAKAANVYGRVWIGGFFNGKLIAEFPNLNLTKGIEEEGGWNGFAQADMWRPHLGDFST